MCLRPVSDNPFNQARAKETTMKIMAVLHAVWERLRSERGAAETSTIFAWIAVGVMVVFGLQALFNSLGADIIGWLRDKVRF